MTTKQDYYEVLGVPKNASDKDIKDAFHKLALKYHPDKDPNNPELVKKFQEINEANQVLSDPQKRAVYDQYGHQGLDPNVAAGWENGNSSRFDVDIAELLKRIFHGGNFGNHTQREKNPSRGADLKYDLKISFEEAVFGCEKEIVVQKSVNCTSCGGSGAEKGSSINQCPVCKGRGSVSLSGGIFSIQQPCHQCNGKGVIIERPCKSCKGTGRVKQNSKLIVKIPSGVDNGQNLKLTGEGEPGINGCMNGDLYVLISVKNHEYFERIGDDIISDKDITFPLAALGGEIDVPTLKGIVKLKIPAGTQNGKVFRLRGYGVKSLKTGEQGDQLVKIFVRTPTDLTDKQKEILKQLSDELPETNSFVADSNKSFFEKVKEALGG